MSRERDYVLGTHDEELARLGLQHRVWKPRVLQAWRRAGFGVGQTILDVGCGPGYATLDLAEIVGASGCVIATDRSRRFLDALERERLGRGLENIRTMEQDLDESELPKEAADGAWARWVFAFVKRPRALLERVAGALRPGGTIVLHEYFNYASWRLAPPCPELEEFVAAVMRSWRADGGEPDIALEMPRWLSELSFEVRSVLPIIEAVTASDFIWQWPKSFVEVGLKRLVELGRVASDRAEAILRAVAAAEAAPGTIMFTPAVLEIIAVRR